MESYSVVYVLGNLFMAYVLYKYMHVFYSDCKIDQIFEKAAYIGYFICITPIYIYFEMPIVVMAANLLILFLLTLLYYGNFKKSVFVVTIIYISLMLVETLFVFLSGYFVQNLLMPSNYESEFGMIAIRIISFALVLLMQGFKNVKCETPMPNIYWASLLAVPLGTVVMLFSIFMSPNISHNTILLCIGCAFAINLLTFYLYDKISALLVEQMNQRITEEQNRLYEHQVQMMKATLEDMRALRHDLKNKLSPLCGLAQSGQSEELKKQLSELTALYSINREYVKSGNETIDSIINYKLHQAEGENIEISTDILIPDELSVPTLDIAVIIGNLLDNALEAVMKENRWIDIKLKYTKGRLMIEISNAYDGKLIKKEDGFASRKSDNDNHGIGIKSVQATIQKYDGVMKFTHDTDKFGVKVLLYI